MAGRVSGGDAFWLTAALGLSGLIVLMLTDSPPIAPTVVAASSDDATLDEVLLEPDFIELPSEDLIGLIVERPLFSPSRRPAPATPEDINDADDAKIQPLAWELVGTMSIGEKPIALMKHPTDGLKRLRQGQHLDSWTIKEISDEQVSLENGDRLETLSLREDQIPQAKLGSGESTGSNGIQTSDPKASDDGSEAADQK